MANKNYPHKFLTMSITCFILAAGLLLTGCGATEKTSDATDATGYDFSYSDRDLDSSYDETSAVKATLADNNIKISNGADGISTQGNTLTITSEGTYLLSGTLSDGQIIVDTPDDEKVQLVLDGVSVTASSGAPLLINESDKVFITLAEGSSNSLTSEAISDDNIDGALFSKGDLCINGSGALDVTSEAGHSIVSKDDLIITGGDINISASKDGIQGKDCIKIKDGNISIVADNDGLRSSNSEDEYRGFISIDGGDLIIDAGYDGLQAETLVRIADGAMDITTGGGSANASTSDSWTSGWGDAHMGAPGGGMDPGAMRAQSSYEDSSGSSSTDDSEDISAKGLKAGLTVDVIGGTLTIDSSDDAVHSNGDINIAGGSLDISSGDDGAHADSNLNVSSGTIDISKSYEGLEGNTITLDGGDITITASDDGLNAAGGSDSSSQDRPGANEFASDDSAFIEINGGSVDITASGDGIDSNGSLDITGGNTTVTCPTTGDTAVLDYTSEGNITGGTFIGTGAVQMAMTFSSSEQGVVAVSVGSQASGTEVILKDGNGDTILTHTPQKDFAIAILSSPDIVSGETYTISVGSTSGEITAD